LTSDTVTPRIHRDVPTVRRTAAMVPTRHPAATVPVST
jgi:hypothetical protein